MFGNLLGNLFAGLGMRWDIFTSNMSSGFRGLVGGRGRKHISRTRNIRKLAGRRRLDDDGVPYGVAGAKIARKAFEGKLTVKSGSYQVPMLHARQK